MSERDLKIKIIIPLFERKHRECEDVDRQYEIVHRCDVLMRLRPFAGDEILEGAQLKARASIATRGYVASKIQPAALVALDYAHPRPRGAIRLNRFFWITTGDLKQGGRVAINELVHGNPLLRERVEIWGVEELVDEIEQAGFYDLLDPLGVKRPEEFALEHESRSEINHVGEDDLVREAFREAETALAEWGIELVKQGLGEELLASQYRKLIAAFERIDSCPRIAHADLKRFGDVLIPVMHRMGDWDIAVAALSRILAEATRQQQWPEGYNWLSWFYELDSRYDEALDAAQNALTHATAAANDAARFQALIRIAKIHRTQGRYQSALEYYAQAKEGAETVGDEGTLAYVLNSSGLTLWHLGELEAALASLEGALGRARALGDRTREAQVLDNLGIVKTALGCYHEALADLVAALQIAEAIKDKRETGIICGNLGEALIRLGRCDEALFYENRALEISEALESAYRIAKAKVRLSLIRRTTGGHEALQRARDLAHQAAVLGEEKGLHHFQIIGHSYEAMACLALGEAQRAVHLSSRAVALLERCDDFDGNRAEIFFHSFLTRETADPGSAQDSLRSAYEELMAQANRIRVTALRERFLTGIELHRAIRQAAERLGIATTFNEIGMDPQDIGPPI